jgi:hypothetical protein
VRALDATGYGGVPNRPVFAFLSSKPENGELASFGVAEGQALVVRSDASGQCVFSLVVSAGYSGTYEVSFAADGVTSESAFKIQISNPIGNVGAYIPPPALDTVYLLGDKITPPPLATVVRADLSPFPGRIVSATVTGGGALLGGTTRCVTSATGSCAFDNLLFASAPGAANGRNFTLTFSVAGFDSPPSAPVAVRNQNEPNPEALANYSNQLWGLLAFFLPIFLAGNVDVGVGAAAASLASYGLVTWLFVRSVIVNYASVTPVDRRVTALFALNIVTFFGFSCAYFWSIRDAALRMRRFAKPGLPPPPTYATFRAENYRALVRALLSGRAVVEQERELYKKQIYKVRKLEHDLVVENDGVLPSVRRRIEVLRFRLQVRGGGIILPVPFYIC